MVKPSNVVLELPKRTAILVDDRAGAEAARSKVRGLFWLTLATVVLGLVVVLASLWKTLATPSVPSSPPAVTVAMPTASPVPPASCEAPAPPEPEVVLTGAELSNEPSTEDAGPSAPPGFPSLDQFP